jgi:hypothetical protein
MKRAVFMAGRGILGTYFCNSRMGDASAYCRATIQTFLFSARRKVFAKLSA